MGNNLNVLKDEDLVRLTRDGNGQAEELLIQRYRDIAKQKSKSYYITGADAEDVIQEGMIGIFKAIRDYDLEGKASFRTFAGLCITRQILTAVERANRQKHQILNNSVSLSKEDNLRDEDQTPMIEQIRSGREDDPESAAVIAETASELERNEMAVFSSLENQVWSCLKRGMGYKEIAEELGRSPKSIDNAIQRIKKKLYAHLR